MNYRTKSIIASIPFLVGSAFATQNILTPAIEIGLYQKNASTTFVRDADMLSPKSVAFDGDKLYINALERGATLVYDTASWTKIKTIEHTKGGVIGKPVEITKTGKYLWIPYYRLSTDNSGVLESKLAMVDKTSYESTWLDVGNVPKMVQAYGENTVAVSNWGDNTVSLLIKDGLSPAPKRFDVTIERAYTPVAGTNRDRACGYCLRGLAFTPDGQFLLVGRMGGGGIAVVKMADKSYIGTITQVPLTPRHLTTSPDGKYLWISTSHSQQVGRMDMDIMMLAIEKLSNKVAINATDMPWRLTAMGGGVRTIASSKDGKWVYAAVHGKSEVAVINADTLAIEQRIAVASFPVGLSVSDDDKWIAVTQQGVKDHGGGNHVDILRRN